MEDLLLLRSFLEVADSGAITRAARRLHVTQPALSRRLQQFETQCGATLLERTRQGILLTEAGRLVQREGLALVKRWERVRDGVRALTDLEHGTVRIGGGATAVSFLLPEAIAGFQRVHPGVLFQVREVGSRDVERGVMAEELELGIVTLPVESDEFEVTPLRSDRIVLVAADGHSLAGRTRIPMSALEGQDLVGFESPSAIRRLIDGALRDAGVRMHVVMELRSIPAILQMVATTKSLAFVSQLGVGRSVEGVRVLAVTGLKIERRLAVIAKRGRPLSPAAVAFQKRLRAPRGA